MRPELQRLLDELNEVRVAVASVEDVSRLATNGWTVGQVLDHLTKIHDSLQPRFAAAVASAPTWNGEADARYSAMDRMMFRIMSGQLPIKLPVPPMFEPGPAGSEAKPACLASLDALLELIRAADEKNLNGIRVSSPVNDRLRVGLLAYIDATVQHARYHKAQI